jgi:hypothetical protein
MPHAGAAATVGAGVGPGVLTGTLWLAQGAEPAPLTAFVGFVAGFLVQILGGAPYLLQALGVAAGLAGTRGVLTRQQVYPRAKRRPEAIAPDVELGRLLSATPPR